MEELTLQDCANYILPGIIDSGKMPDWPPDVFAIAATILQKSGAYLRVADGWPPVTYSSAVNPLGCYTNELHDLGRAWRLAWVHGTGIPTKVSGWWDDIVRTARTAIPLISVREDPISESIIQLCAAADEASAGFGLPPGNGKYAISERQSEDKEAEKRVSKESIRTLAIRHRHYGNSLCKAVHPSRVRVLPKLHTPQSGLTIRSLSRHLALCTVDEVQTIWLNAARSRISEKLGAGGDLSINLLLVPWPPRIRPSQFLAHDDGAWAKNTNPHGLFDFEPDSRRPPVLDIFQDAVETVGPIQGVIMPELSLNRRTFEPLSAQLRRRSAFVVAGIAGRPGARNRGLDFEGNYLRFDVATTGDGAAKIHQWKHHRWKLDKSQIRQYGLGGRLNTQRSWWENTPLRWRSLTFVAMREWLTVCPLLCEDLARPDPLADLVRAVGPNLVIALLMDGPQLSARWPGRYASVLADDPGCSVLTLSSLGMTELSRPTGINIRHRVVALWKDRSSGAVEIQIPENAAGVVLTLSVENLEEWTADGRKSARGAAYPILSGVHPIAQRIPV